MSEITWKESYNLGNVEIDCEHRVFVKIIQKIESAVDNKRGKSYVKRLLTELEKYAEFHFISEENIMIHFSYPAIVFHKREHELLLAKLRELILKVEIDQYPLEELASFLLKWFSEHTLGVDRNLIEFLGR